MAELDIPGIGRVHVTPAELLEMARLARGDNHIPISTNGASAPQPAPIDQPESATPFPTSIEQPQAPDLQVESKDQPATPVPANTRRVPGKPTVAQMVDVWDKFRKDSMREAIWYFADHGPRVNTNQAAKVLNVKAMSGLMSAFSKACNNAGGFDVRRWYQLSGPTLVFKPEFHALLKETVAYVDPEGLYRSSAGTDLSPSVEVDAEA